jgi:cbb3-type cytochrome c oxidase subunit I/cbb3-type cytochrome c oxidase subunit II
MDKLEKADQIVPNPPESDFKAGDSAAKTWFLFAALWFPIFASVGFILAIKFFYPQFLGGEIWDTFGRLRPAHTNGVLFGFVSSGLLGAMFYIVPRLCGRSLKFSFLAKIVAVVWNMAILAGIIWITLGGSQGREYAELPFAIDVLVMIALISMGVVVFSTVLARKEKKLYVSLWYYIGTLMWFPIVYFVGNVMWHPATGALNGTVDAIFNWYYGHNVLGLWFTTLGIPAWYYFIPKLIQKPLYSHLLSLIAFFSIGFFYTGVGSHHLLQSPIPEWAKTIAVVMSILMLVPVLAFLVNIGLTMRGAWHKLVGNPPLQFIFTGFAMYFLASLQGSLQALRDTNAFLHFSQWPVGHAHLALLGGFGLLAVGATYFLIPRVTGFKIYSQGLMKLSWWLAFVGFLSFFAAMTVVGFQQNSNWWSHINVVETLPVLRVGFVWRAVSGGVVGVAAFVFGYNVIMSFLKGREKHYEEEPVVIQIKPARRSRFQTISQSELNLPTIIFGGLAVFAVMTFMVVAMPFMFTYQNPSWRANEMTATQAEGQDLYRTLGCFYCHNQFVRPQDWAYGYTSQPGDFYYSVPNFLGTERTGPPLGQIGGKMPTEWHIAHHTDPRAVSPSSIMPSFAFLSRPELVSLTDYLQNLGSEDLSPTFQSPVPYTYRNEQNPNLELMAVVQGGYDADNQTYSGDEAAGQQWADLFSQGKSLFSGKCLRCHGASGNGQGPYARQTLARPANLNERIKNFVAPGDNFHFWRISEGVPGTAMPPWAWSLDAETRWSIATYELSFVEGAIRTVDGGVSDAAGDAFNDTTLSLPPIAGTLEQFNKGQALFNLYCAQCHGTEGLGDGAASIATAGGYIRPQPANFEESGRDFTKYGRYVWKIKEGVETTNMPPWKAALSDEEIYQLVFYVQGFSKVDDYNTKWAILYSDPYAQGLKK